MNGTLFQNLTGSTIQTTLNWTHNLYTITVHAHQHFEQTFTSYNASTSGNLIANLTYFGNVTVIDAWDNASLTFNATIYNVTHSADYTDQATLRPGFQGIHSINITRGGYLPVSGISINVSGGRTNKIELSEAFLYFSAREWLSNKTLLIFNVTLKNSTGTVLKTNITTTGNISFAVKAGSYNTTFNIQGYFFNHSIVTATALTGAQTTADAFSALLAVNATQKNGSIIPSFTATVTGATYPGVTLTSAVTTGTAYFYLVNGSWNISFAATDYLPNYTVPLFNITAPRHNHTFTTWKLNTINVTFKHEINLTILSGINISIQMIGGSGTNYHFNTSTGNIFSEIISPQQYTMRYWGKEGGYPQRQYIFTLVNETYNEFTLYLLEGSYTTNVTLKVVDENQYALEGARVNVLRYDVPTNAYLMIESSTTNFMGESLVHLSLFDTYYKFEVYYPTTTLKKVTDPNYVTQTALTLQISLTESPGSDIITEYGISSSLNYTDTTQNFNFWFSDALGTVTRGCLEVKKLTPTGEVNWNLSCAEAAAGTVLAHAEAANGTTYHARGYVEYGGNEVNLRYMVKSWIESLNMGRSGLFLVAMLVILFGMVGIWSAQVAVILAGFAPFVASMAGLLKMSPAATLPAAILGLVLAFLLRRSSP